VLTVVPVGAAVLWTRSLRRSWQRLPWVIGSLATIAITGAWYWAAERATPGFLEYFIVGEHWKRFVEPGWTGDLYGAAHSRPRGTIWLLWIAAALPWSIGALVAVGRVAWLRNTGWRAFVADPWRVYFVLWAISPMVVFTPAGNILITYVLPALPAFVLLLGDAWRPDDGKGNAARDSNALRPAVARTLVAGAIVPIAFIGVVVLLQGAAGSEHSQKALTRAYALQRAQADTPLVYFRDRPDSAEFYSGGKAQRVTDIAAFEARLATASHDLFAMRARDFDALPDADRQRLQLIDTFGDYRLLRETRR